MGRSLKAAIVIVLSAEMILTLFSMLTMRIPRGHDGFILLSLQYFFLNGIYNGDNIPQWIPYLTQGTVSTWWYAITATPVQSILYLFAKLKLLFGNFIPLYHMSFFCQTLILIVGTERWASRYTATMLGRMVVVISVAGSAIAYDQPWFGLQLFYAIPLILYLLHLFVESGQWRYAFFAGNLLALQHLGNLPYFIPVTTFVIAVYFVSYSIVNWEKLLTNVNFFKFNCYPRMLAALCGVAVSFALVYYLSQFATTGIVNHNMRLSDGTVGLDTFLTYGGHLNLATPVELFLGISPMKDFTFYLGILFIPGIIAYLLGGIKKDNIPILLTAISIILLILGTQFAVMVYYIWPMMKYYRHLALIITLLKPFLCLLGGIGIERLWVGLNSDLAKQDTFLLSLLCIVLSVWLGILLAMYLDAAWTIKVIRGIAADKLPPFDLFKISRHSFPVLLKGTTLKPLVLRTAFSLILYIVFFNVVLQAKIKQNQILLAICGTLLIYIHCIDLYSYKFSQMLLRSGHTRGETKALFTFQAIPYNERRSEDLFFHNDRVQALHQTLPFVTWNSWLVSPALFTDMARAPFRTDNWSAYIDKVIQAYAQHLPAQFVFPFPIQVKSARIISGLDQDKIQFYSKVMWDYDTQHAANVIALPEYESQFPILEDKVNPSLQVSLNKNQYTPWLQGQSALLALAYHIQHYSPDTLELTVVNPQPKPIWLYRSEAYHHLWRASVNGLPVPIYRANLGYQAISLDPGLNKIVFKFGSPIISYLQYLVSLWSMIWLISILLMVVRRSTSLTESEY